MACQTKRPKRDLVRVVRTPSGTVVLDPSGRQDGRGAYVCFGEACWQKAAKGGILARRLRVSLDRATLDALGREIGEARARHRELGAGPMDKDEE